MTARTVVLKGCDDTTRFVVDNLTDDDVKLLYRVAALSAGASEFDCQPRMHVELPGAEDSQ